MNCEPTLSQLIILDRDGVINEDSDHYIRSVHEWVVIPGSMEAIARLSQAGYRIAIATNQSGIARGYFSLQTLEAIHQRLINQVAATGGHIDTIKFCPHSPDERCHCRKPKPGLIEQICAELAMPPAQAWVVGDSLRDIQAGQCAGCRTALVKTGKGTRTLTHMTNDHWQGLNNTQVFDNLLMFSNALLTHSAKA